MKDTGSLHLKVQELCNCYAETDPLRSMSQLKKDADKDEAALKWVALAILHGVNNNAKQITLTRTREGTVQVTAEYRESGLPSPGPEIGEKVIAAIREITHIEEEKGELPLAIGIRDSSLEVKVKIKGKAGQESVSLRFGK